MTRRSRPDAEIARYLAQRPSLSEVKARFPEEWAVVRRELAEALRDGDADAVRRYAQSVAAGAQARAGTPRRRDPLVAARVRQYLAAETLRQMSVSAATGVSDGRLRFNLVNGYLAQKLLFREGLERKPVSLWWFRVVWPLVWQKRYLMPLVEPQGIYCFYSGALIRRLAEVIGERECLEIAAGDGALSRFLRRAGVQVTATDDRSWAQVETSDDVERQEARQALRAHAPRAVICSWPPAGNSFERWVFETPSVELYIAIGSRHEFATGNREAYRRQRGFTVDHDVGLGRLVLPPELDSEVLVFRRGG